MPSHPLPNPSRLRQIPARFSWVDHRLVRDHYFEQSSCEALALYLFLLTVADRQGLSYYADSNLMARLNLGKLPFDQARTELIHRGLISYRKPLYQVLALEPVMASEQAILPQPVIPLPSKQKEDPISATSLSKPKRSNKGPLMLRQILKHLAQENAHD